MIPTINIFSADESELDSTTTLFEKEGFNVLSYSGVNEETINAVYKSHPDVVLLDLEIFNSDGIELCYKLKKENELNTFVVLFSEQFDDYIQIEAFKAGADDYVVRPINPRVFVKKIKALLSRRIKKPQTKAKLLSYKNLKIDRDSYVVILDNKKYSLPRKEFEMLFLLINEPQKVFSREEIYKAVWDKESLTNGRIIDVHIRKIREKIGQNIVKTIKGVGYQLA
jgi:two-component system alkaline phosphatase synthesis response regulator PhoP